MADPLGRKYQVPRKVKNRHHVDSVCQYILEHEKNDFLRGNHKPAITHVYYDAYAVIYGIEPANLMLIEARKKWEGS